MAKDPAVLFYTSDFLSGTSFFNDEQKGQYITLLCQQHQLYSIPENHMINVCKSIDSPVVAKFIKDTDGKYYNVRMREEGEKRANFCASRSNNKSGRPSKEIIRKSYDNHMENENISENESENVIKNTTKRFIEPTLEEVKSYCEERKNEVDYQKWHNFYACKGWMVGKNKMKDWKAAVRTWEKNISDNLTDTQKRNISKFNDFEKKHLGGNGGLQHI